MAAGRRYSAITSRNIEKKQANPKLNGKPKDCRKRLDAMEERGEGGGGGGGVGGLQHGSCRGFRCARPKIRQEMRREDEKKKELSAKIEVRRHNHTSLG